MRVCSLVITLNGPGKRVIPDRDKSCQTAKNARVPIKGRIIFCEFFFQNSPRLSAKLFPFVLLFAVLVILLQLLEKFFSLQ